MAEKEYLERGMVLELLKDVDRYGYLDASDINSIPAADVAPVRHGRWVHIPLNMDPEYFAYKYNLRKKCSVCSYAMPEEYPNFNICPNCGAKMDLEGGEG